MARDFDPTALGSQLLGKPTLHPRFEGKPPVFGSGSFFAGATELLVESTQQERELSGACYGVMNEGALVLVGLQTRAVGTSSHVPTEAGWGAVLWHTHPGLSFSLAAFSDQDLESARDTGRPMLVIGYNTASPDVLGVTQALHFVTEADHVVIDRLLRFGVAARVCWPDGTVRPVRRYRASGWRDAVDDATFAVDRVMGAAARGLDRRGFRGVSMKLAKGIGHLRRLSRKRINKD